MTDLELVKDTVEFYSFNPELRGYTPGIGCRYRALNGDGQLCKCAAGRLIPDEKYSIDLEGSNADEGLVAKVLEGEGYRLDLVRRLQVFHDASFASDLRSTKPYLHKSGLEQIKDTLENCLSGPESIEIFCGTIRD